MKRKQLIKHNTFKKEVTYELCSNSITLMEPYEKVRNLNKYKAPSTSIIFDLIDDEMQFIVGRKVDISVMQDLARLANRQEKKLVMVRLESMESLYLVDKVLQFSEMVAPDSD